MNQQTLSQNQKKKLKAQSQSLEPLVHVGKNGLSAEFHAELEKMLEARELVKMKFVQLKDEKKTLAPQIAQEHGAALVMLVGHVAVFYRQHPVAQNRKIVF